MTIINCTPHAVSIVTDNGTTTFPPSGICPRVASTEIPMPSIPIDGMEIPTCKREYGEVTNLPDPASEVFLIVSSMVKAAVPERSDLIVPHDFVRDDSGNIVGCKRFAR